MIQPTLQFVPWALLLADDAPPADGSSRPFLVQLMDNPMIPMVGVIAIFYLVFIVPERRRKAEEAKRMAAIKKNDRVITSGGLHGTVVNAPGDSDVVTVRLDDSGTLRVKVSRWALTVVEEKKSSPTASKSETSSKNEPADKDS